VEWVESGEGLKDDDDDEVTSTQRAVGRHMRQANSHFRRKSLYHLWPLCCVNLMNGG